MVGPDFQQVLFLVHFLSLQLDHQPQQALLPAVPLHPAEFDEAQRPHTGVAVDGQRGQAQQFEALGREIGPGMGLGRGLLATLLLGWAFSHRDVPSRNLRRRM
ncbi:hypothetical protein D3C81_1848020 [compost metagenome]